MTDNHILENFKNILRKEGYKVTPQRIAVLEEMVGDNGHRESEDIYLAIKSRKTNLQNSLNICKK